MHRFQKSRSSSGEVMEPEITECAGGHTVHGFSICGRMLGSLSWEESKRRMFSGRSKMIKRGRKRSLNQRFEKNMKSKETLIIPPHDFGTMGSSLRFKPAKFWLSHLQPHS